MTVEPLEPASHVAEPATAASAPPPKPEPSPELIGRLQALGIYPRDEGMPAGNPVHVGKPHLHHRWRWLIGLLVTVLLALAASVLLLAVAWPPFGAAVRQIIDIPSPVVEALQPLSPYLSVDSKPVPAVPAPAAVAPSVPMAVQGVSTAPPGFATAPAPAPSAPFLPPMDWYREAMTPSPVVETLPVPAAPGVPPDAPLFTPTARTVAPPPSTAPAMPAPAPAAAAPAPLEPSAPPVFSGAVPPRSSYGWGYPTYYAPTPQGYYGAPPR
jgi:hypothetical protein